MPTTLLIVNFHYFREEKYSSGIYPTNLNAFQSQLLKLSKVYSFISQSELVTIITQRKPIDRNYCLITFDDGLKEQINAFKWLRNHNVPAIFYVPTKPLMDGRVLDVHKLHIIRSTLSDSFLLNELKSTINYNYSQNDLAIAREQYRYDSDLAREVKYILNFKLNSEVRHIFLSNLFNSIIHDESKFAEEFYMNETDVEVIAHAGMLGSHGHSHTPLTQIKNAKDDIIQSIEYLEKLSNIPIHSFSYPYGGKSAVNEEIASYFSQTNVAFALTMFRGVNDLNQAYDPLLLKRVDTNDVFQFK